MPIVQNDKMIWEGNIFCLDFTLLPVFLHFAFFIVFLQVMLENYIFFFVLLHLDLALLPVTPADLDGLCSL